jgi:hypothetical protein
MLTHGTAHFVSFITAIRYYHSQGYARSEREAAMLVDQKLSAGEIQIGAPDIPPGARLVLLDNNCRYGLEEPEKT